MSRCARGRIVRLLREMISTLRSRLPAQDILTAEELLEHGEWGLAFDVLCTQAYEYEIEISQELYSTASQLADAMQLDPNEWSFATKLVRR